jgi:general secretion pathway protein F
MLLLFASFGAMLFIFAYVVPQFEGLLVNGRVEVSGWLGMLFGISHVVEQFWVYLLGLVLIGLLVFDRYSKSGPGQLAKDRLTLRLPFLGAHFRKREAARFTRVLAILTGRHVPLLKSVEIVLGTVRNRVLQSQLTGLPDEMKKGAGMAGPLRETQAFPPFVARMVTIGEETGGLADMFEDLARYYDREVESELKAFLAVLEPAIILFVGVIVGTVVISILSALMSVTDYIG